jgi:heat shock protein HslJ
MVRQYLGCLTIASAAVVYSLVYAQSGMAENERYSHAMLAAAQQGGIENRHWRIAKYRGDENNSASKDELIDSKVPADVVFTKGQVHGGSGCGGWVGTYTIAGDTLISDVVAGVGGLCTSEGIRQGYWVEKALKGERRVEKDNDNIILRDKNDRAMILLVPF